MPRLPKNAHLEAAIQRFVDDFARIIANAVHQSVFMALADAPPSRRRALRAPAPVEEAPTEPEASASDAAEPEGGGAPETDPEAEPSLDGEAAPPPRSLRGSSKRAAAEPKPKGKPTRKGSAGRVSQRDQPKSKGKEPVRSAANPRRRAAKKAPGDAATPSDADAEAPRGRRKAKQAAKAEAKPRGRKAAAKQPGSKRRGPEQLNLF